MTNSADPDQTASIGAVCSGFTLSASILDSSVMLGIFAADDLSRRHFQMHFFLALKGLLNRGHYLKHFCEIIFYLDQSFRK